MNAKITNWLFFSFHFEEKVSAFEWCLINWSGGQRHFYPLNVYFSFILIQSMLNYIKILVDIPARALNSNISILLMLGVIKYFPACVTHITHDSLRAGPICSRKTW